MLAFVSRRGGRTIGPHRGSHALDGIQPEGNLLHRGSDGGGTGQRRTHGHGQLEIELALVYGRDQLRTQGRHQMNPAQPETETRTDDDDETLPQCSPHDHGVGTLHHAERPLEQPEDRSGNGYGDDGADDDC